MKTPIDIAVTGAAGQISYSLLFRLAAGNFLGDEQPINLHLLEITPALQALNGVVMELNDCAFPLLNKVVVSDDPRVAFKNVDYAFLVGAKPRGPGMERKDLLLSNAAIFSEQGKALNDVANRNVKVLVTGNPANTNALIAMKNAPDLDASCFSAMTRLDHNRSISQLAEKTGASTTDIKNVAVWGNHSSTQYPDLHFANVKGQNALSLVGEEWFKSEFIPTVQQRGAAIIQARGQSSAASAAHAALVHMKSLVDGTENDDWVSMGMLSDGYYDLESDLVYSFPVTIKNGQATVVNDLDINEYSREQMIISQQELIEERDAVKHLL